jgi:type IV pilus assembly protein PilQ
MGIDFSLMGGLNFDTILGNNTTVSGALSGNILNAANNGSTTATPANLIKQGYAGFTTGNYDTQVGQAGQGGLQIGIVRNNLGVFISALESVADTTVLANPKVLVLNKQAGEVQVGQQLGYETTTVTQTTSTQTVQFLDTGTILSFRPYIGDNGFIRMEIHPEDSTGSVTNNLPDKTTTEVTSNVMIKDGNTIVIGGMFKDNSSSSRNQVPILGNLPIVGALFRSQTDNTQRQEVIILLTPHIIKDDAAYSKASEQEQKEAEKMRVGVRKGMMWFGRERLAETAYENAEAELAKHNPNMNLVLWHLNCAINLNPKFIEAIDLKEKITGTQVTAADNSAIRGFVREQIMTDIAPPSTMPSMPTTQQTIGSAQ